MRLYHGTSAELRPIIGREGLQGRGRPIFLADVEMVARRYARARAARDLQSGGESAGLIVVVDIDPAALEPDPFEAIREPGQHLVRRDITPAELVELRTIRWAWGVLSWTRTLALADWAALERVRDDALDRWRPPRSIAEMLGTAQRDLDRLRSSPNPRIGDPLRERPSVGRERRRGA